MGWYHEDGSLCSAGHVRFNRLCVEGGGPVHGTSEEIARLRRELALVDRLSRETTDDLGRRLSALEESEPAVAEEQAEVLVYIPECIFVDNNLWDGRTRYGVCASLNGALAALKDFADEGHPLVATEAQEADGGSAHCVAVYMVHRKDEPPRTDGVLWIFVEKVST